MILPRKLLILVFLPLFSGHADCGKSVALLGSDPNLSHEAPREELLSQIAGLYSAAINGKAPMEAAVLRMKELADREGQSFEEVIAEVESLAVSPSEGRARVEERRALREEEQLRLYNELEPYLDRIGRKHRQVIERKLILAGLVNPLSTGEVEFRFRGQHRFLLGAEMLYGYNAGVTKEHSFGPSDGFAIGQVPVTQFLYFLAALSARGRRIDPTPSHFKEGAGAVVLRLGGKTYSLNPNHPVEQVGARDADTHAERVSEILRLPYGLPTENQWEFANRAGSATGFHFGDDERLLPRYGWFEENAGKQTQSVGQLLPNAFHLYDTHGNVGEWTSAEPGANNIIRGGGWDAEAEELRSAFRDVYGDPDYRFRNLGFRLVRPITGYARPSHVFTFGEPELDPKAGSAKSGGEK
jgi:hypothetical protein